VAISKLRRVRGVTLIEVAVVMAIVGIMALFMAPAIGEWIDNYRIRQTARDISSTLQQAKMQTISTRTIHSVTFTPSPSPGSIPDSYQLTPGGSVTLVPKGVTISVGAISFNPDGTSSGGTITIVNEKGKQYQVTINSVGRINIQEI